MSNRLVSPVLELLLAQRPGPSLRDWQRELGWIVEQLPPMGHLKLPTRRTVQAPITELLPAEVLQAWSRGFIPEQVELAERGGFVAPYEQVENQTSLQSRWWSLPMRSIGQQQVNVLRTTSGPWLDAPCVALFGTEDTFINSPWLDQVATAVTQQDIAELRASGTNWRSIRTLEKPRVYEVDGPAAWIQLADTYPRILNHIPPANGADELATWFPGPFCEPDWPKVAQDFDAVHLSQLGYLQTAYAAMSCAAGTTSICGWGPDLTVWLNYPLAE